MSISKINNEIDNLVEDFNNSLANDQGSDIEVFSGTSSLEQTLNDLVGIIAGSELLILMSVILTFTVVAKFNYKVIRGVFNRNPPSFGSFEEEFMTMIDKPLPDPHEVDKSVAGSREVIERYNRLLNSYTGLHTAPKRYEIMITTPALLDLNVLPTKKMDEAIISLMEYADGVLPNFATEPSMLVTDTDLDDNNALVTEMSSRIDKAEELWIQAEQHASVVGIPNTASTHYELGKKLINQLTGPGVTDNERVSAWNRLKDLSIKMGVSENVVSGTQEYTHELIPATRMAIES